MMLIADARRLWLRFWSVRFALLSGFLQLLEIALPHIAPGSQSYSLGLLAMGCAFAAGIVRVIRQDSLYAARKEPPR
jgi:hypothetical protein